MQIVRTLGELGYGDRELALDFIIGIVLQIKVPSCGYEAHQSVILIRIESCLKIEAVFPVFVSLMQDSSTKAFFFSMGVFHSLSGFKSTDLVKLLGTNILRVWLVSKQRAA